MQAQRGTRVTAEQPSSTSVPPSLLAALSDCCTSMDRKRMGHRRIQVSTPAPILGFGGVSR